MASTLPQCSSTCASVTSLIERNDVAALQSLFENSNLPIIFKESKDVTCVHIAAKYDEVDVLEFFHTVCHHDINAQMHTGATPLHVACENGSKNAFQWLVKNVSHSLSIQDNAGYTPMHLAADQGHSDIVWQLLRLEGPAKATGPYKLHPIHLAAIRGDMKTINRLLRFDKSCISLKTFNGKNSCYLAAEHKHLDCFDFLVLLGCPPLEPADDRTNVLHKVARHGDNDFLDYIFNYAEILEDAVDVNCGDNGLSTPLHYACSFGKVSTAERLLNYGAKVLQDKQGISPIHTAAAIGESALLEKFLQAIDDNILKDGEVFRGMREFILCSKYPECKHVFLQFEKEMNTKELRKETSISKRAHSFNGIFPPNREEKENETPYLNTTFISETHHNNKTIGKTKEKEAEGEEARQQFTSTPTRHKSFQEKPDKCVTPPPIPTREGRKKLSGRHSQPNITTPSDKYITKSADEKNYKQTNEMEVVKDDNVYVDIEDTPGNKNSNVNEDVEGGNSLVKRKGRERRVTQRTITTMEKEAPPMRDMISIEKKNGKSMSGNMAFQNELQKAVHSRKSYQHQTSSDSSENKYDVSGEIS